MDMKTDRRRFIGLVALGGGASWLAAGSYAPAARAAGTSEALLLSCMDYRLMDEIERYMSARGLRDRYVHLTLSGASLGAVSDQHPAWIQTFWDHLAIVVETHRIRRVILMDHRECDAFRLALGDDHLKDPKTKRQAHAAELRKLKDRIREKYPEVEVEMKLMALGGRVEAIT